jgi:hypothetical protein
MWMNSATPTQEHELAQRVEPRRSADALLPVFLCALTVTLFLLRRGLQPVSDPDAWLHLRLGTFLLDGGRFGSPDPWTTSATTAYRPNQWLAEVLGVWVYSWAGLPGIAFMRFLGILLFFAALLWLARSIADPLPATMAAMAAWIAAYGSLAERPQLISLIMLAVVTRVWWATLDDGRARWWLVPLTWAWACIHGLWIIGIAVGVLMIVARVADRPIKWRESMRLLLIPVASLVAAGLTPLGPALILNPLKVNGTVADYVQEWQSATVRNPLLAIFLATALCVVILWARAGRTPPSRILLFVAAAFCALWMARLIAVGAILLAPLFAEALQGLRHRAPSRWGRSELRMWGLIAITTTVVAIVLAPVVADTPAKVPTRLQPTMSAIPSGTTVLVDHGLSGWVMWTEPRLKVALDLRSEIYSARWIKGFQEAMAVMPGWQSYVRDTGATYALLPNDSPLGLALGERLAWSKVASGDGYILWRSSGAQPTAPGS